MASFPKSDDAGYATAAAMAVSLAIGLIATAVAGRSIAELRLARAELRRTEADYALAGAQALAAAAIVSSGQTPPFRWRLDTGDAQVSALAEPEGSKLSLAAAAHLDDAVLGRFGVRDPAGLRRKLKAASNQPLEGDIGLLDAAALWRRCASTFISPFGSASGPMVPSYRSPDAGEHPASWRIAEIWRVSVSRPDGWRDDRIVRLTGDPGRPAAVIVRRFDRRASQDRKGEGEGCETVLMAAPKA